MKIVIPMSGIGRRFLEAGYKEPKPLIDVDGKPMIHHVIDLFPGEKNFLFICNDKHLAETPMRKILAEKVPSCLIQEVSIHNRKGPVHAVSQAFQHIDDDDEVIVSYCDYGTVWNYQEFLKDMRQNHAAGGIAAYIGFHPHMLGTDNYAFMKHENMFLVDIQEKKSFTNNKMMEYASNGTYYFRTGALLKYYFTKLMDQGIDVGGEYYVSLVYKLMVQDHLAIRIFEIQKMLQWGTPSDLEVYKHWASFFSKRKLYPLKFSPSIEKITILLPMAGAGSRFSLVGYELPKPLLPVEGSPMVVQAVECLPPAKEIIFVTLNEHLQKYNLHDIFHCHFPHVKVIPISNVTEGQACTCEIGIKHANIQENEPLLISACDNGAYYDTQVYETMVKDPQIDVIVWSFTNNQTSKLYPHMYAWLDVDQDGYIHDVSIKKPFEKKENKHAIIGSMYFRSTKIFNEGLAEVYQNNLRTNGEFYVDNLLQPLIQKGYKLKVFEVDHYLCWGTPNDYKTYSYWSEHFS
jgi:NDP-sugar pyrophosphorylase family protein